MKTEHETIDIRIKLYDISVDYRDRVGMISISIASTTYYHFGSPNNFLLSLYIQHLYQCEN